MVSRRLALSTWAVLFVLAFHVVSGVPTRLGSHTSGPKIVRGCSVRDDRGGFKFESLACSGECRKDGDATGSSQCGASWWLIGKPEHQRCIELLVMLQMPWRRGLFNLANRRSTDGPNLVFQQQRVSLTSSSWRLLEFWRVISQPMKSVQ